MNHYARTLVYFTKSNIRFAMLNEQFITGDSRREMLTAIREFDVQVRNTALSLADITLSLADLELGLDGTKSDPTPIQSFLSILNGLEYLDLIAARQDDISSRGMDLLDQLHAASLCCVEGAQSALNAIGIKPLGVYNPMASRGPVRGSEPPSPTN